MNEPHLEELVSAYLDDEVSEEERSRVEKALDESAELQQLLAELQALRSAISSLPRFQVEADFPSRVTDEALARQGGAPSSDRAPAQAPPVDHVEITTRETSPAIPFDQRRWTAALITLSVLAAALLFVFFRPPAVKEGTLTRQGPTPDSNSAQGNSQEGEQEGNGPQEAVPDRAVARQDNPQQGELQADPDALATSGRNGSNSNNAPSRQTAEALQMQAPQEAVVAVEPAPMPGASLRMVDLGAADVQVVRLSVAPKVVRDRALDQLLARHGIPFMLDQAVIPMPEEEARMTAAILERGFDMIYLDVGRAQLRGLLDELSERSQEFSVSSVYFAKADAYAELLVMQVTEPDPDDPLGLNGNALLPLPGVNSTGEAQAVLAWRPYLASWQKVNELFPPPRTGPPPKEFSEREWDALVRADPDGDVRLLFILRIAAEQP